MAEGEAHVLEPPNVLAKIPIRLSASVGAVYFATSLILLQSGGALQQHALPLLGIAAAFSLFVYQTITLVAGINYRRRLRTYAQQGVVVFVPLGLLGHVERAHDAQGRKMTSDLLDADLEKTSVLVRLFDQEGFSPKVEKALQKMMS